MIAKDGRLIDELWSQYEHDPCERIRNALMEHYLPLVRQSAQRLQSRLPSSVEVDDLTSVGVFGLADAIDAYKLDRKTRFTTFSARRIRGAMLDELRAIDWLPRQARGDVRRCAAASENLQSRLGRQPSDEELQRHLKMPDSRYRNVTLYMRNAAHRSIDAGTRADGTNQPLSIADDRARDPARETHRTLLCDLITNSLSRQERLLVILYYYEGMKFKDIGTTLGVSESRISQMHSSIVVKLKTRMHDYAGELRAVAA